MNHLTSQKGHQNMAAIRGKDTKPEMILQRGLWKRGFIYKLNHKHPDLVLRKYRTNIFVNFHFGMGLWWIQAQWSVLIVARYWE